MESDRQRRGHPLHDASHAASASALPTLPSVAELIASSSTPSTGTIPAYHQPASPLPPILCSTPHNPTPIAGAANAPSPAEQSPWGATAHHASHASPTGSTSSTATSERVYYSPAQHQAQQGVTFPGHQPPQGNADAHRPMNSLRQDSAVSTHHRADTTKEGSSLVRPSEPDISYSHRNPNNSHNSTSPALASLLPHQSASPVPPSSHLATPSSSHEHVTIPFAQTQDPPTRHPHSPSYSDSPNTGNTRQQRYNVRFAANYTSTNMPSAQRSRQSPPLSVTAAPTETAEPAPTPQPEHAAPSIDPLVHSIIMGVRKPANGNTQSDSYAHDSAVERCAVCNEAWSRAPVDASEWCGQEPATTVQDYVKAQDDVVARLRQHQKDNDEAFDQWKKRHSQCLASSTATLQAGTSNGFSNKRKSEGSHGDMTKLRKVAFDGHSTTAPPVRPSAPI